MAYRACSAAATSCGSRRRRSPGPRRTIFRTSSVVKREAPRTTTSRISGAGSAAAGAACTSARASAARTMELERRGVAGRSIGALEVHAESAPVHRDAELLGEPVVVRGSLDRHLVAGHRAEASLPQLPGDRLAVGGFV